MKVMQMEWSVHRSRTRGN